MPHSPPLLLLALILLPVGIFLKQGKCTVIGSDGHWHVVEAPGSAQAAATIDTIGMVDMGPITGKRARKLLILTDDDSLQL